MGIDERQALLTSLEGVAAGEGRRANSEVEGVLTDS